MLPKNAIPFNFDSLLRNSHPGKNCERKKIWIYENPIGVDELIMWQVRHLVQYLFTFKLSEASENNNKSAT